MERDRGEVARRIAAFAARFREYTFQNTLLILLQRPDASWVLGRHGWEDLGRRVRRGARPIRIRAPRLARGCRGGAAAFRDVRVWDVGDTEGPAAALEAGERPPPAGDEVAAARLVADLEAWVEGSGLRLGVTPPNAREEASTDGIWVRVRAGGNPHARAARLAHEIAHVLLHFRREPGGAVIIDGADILPGSPVEELEAELTAFLLLAGAGLDPTAGSACYLASWRATATRVEAAFPHCLAVASRVLRDCRRRRYRRVGPWVRDAGAGPARRACA
jgi:hypothetical protein